MPGELKDIELDLIVRGKYQPRVDFDQQALAELAESIRAQGVAEPILVRPIHGGRYELVAGERRWRAAQMVPLAAIPAVVRQMGDEEAAAIALIENINREPLSPLEEARGYQRMMDDFGYTQREVAEMLGESRSAVANKIRLLDLGSVTQELLRTGQLSEGHAKVLLTVKGPIQGQIAREVVRHGWSVRQTERRIKAAATASEDPPKGGEGRRDPDIVRLENELTGEIGAQVSLSYKGSGDGSLAIRFHSLEQLDGIIELLKRQR